ncbi:MAG: tetratricopeptide repeat protein, partial [Cyanobacteria bacterium J06639_14]
YEAALSRKPDFGKASFQKGQVQQQQGNYEAAIAAYEAVLKLNWKDAAEVWYGKATCHALQDEVEPALTALESAIAAAPGLKATAQADPNFEAIKGTLRFRALVEDIPSDGV